MRSPPAELSPSLYHQWSSASALTQSRSWLALLPAKWQGRRSQQRDFILTLRCTLAPASLPVNPEQGQAVRAVAAAREE